MDIHEMIEDGIKKYQANMRVVCISEESALKLKEMMEAQTDMIPLSIHEAVCESAYRKLMDEIEKHRWFTIDERPDNMPDQVICHWEDGAVETFSSQNINEWNQAHPQDKITHWMFSPEPPGGEG